MNSAVPLLQRRALACTCTVALLGFSIAGLTRGQDEVHTTRPRLYRVIVPVPDIDRGVAFYKELLGFEGETVGPGRYYFDCGGVILACFDPRADGDDFDATPNPDHVYFAVKDLDAVFRRARSLPCRKLDPQIKTQPWGERCFYATDPFGNPICFVDERTVFTGER